MRASHRWLTELSGVDATPDEAAERLTFAGVQVEAILRFGGGLDLVVVAEVRAKKKIEKRDALTLVTIWDGEREIDVVCGAPNVPEPGGRVLFARVGSKLPNGMEIGERKIAGVVSRGMICSETELAIGTDEDGIVVLGADVNGAAGTPIADALGLTDAVFELGLTPNRADCLGHIGLARDLALLFGVPFAPPVPPAPVRAEPGDPLAAVEIVDPDRCARYGASFVRGVRIEKSPFWLRYRLHCLGLRPIHNVVDATNLVLLEHGHPTHAFDLARVRGKKIVVRLARDGERMATLDGVERTFTADDLMICDAEGPVAVAGVMGGAESEIAETTRDVLIEVAHFDPRSVRRTGRRLGLHTDAGHRFERGVDPNGVPAVMRRTAQLVADLAGGTVVGDGVDENPRPIYPVRIALSLDRADALLGFATEPTDAQKILEGLGCEVDVRGDRALSVSAPTHRPDLVRAVDLIEELARVQGYDCVPTITPFVRPSAEGTPRAVTFERRARERAAALGLDEAVTYAFVSPADLAAARVASRGSGTNTDAVLLENPLSEERSVMRTSLLPGLARAARHAQHRQVETVGLFEVGTTFTASTGRLPREEKRLALLLAGRRPTWIGEPDAAFDLYDGKGAVVALTTALVGAAPELSVDELLGSRAAWSHPRRAAIVRIDGVELGVLGELHPDVAEALELEGRVVYAELSLPLLLAAADARGVPQARALPRFPSVGRDVAIHVAEALSAGEVTQAIAEAADGLAEEVRLFDLYRGDQVPVGRKSLAFRVTYRDAGGTLTDATVDTTHERVKHALTSRFGAVVR